MREIVRTDTVVVNPPSLQKIGKYSRSKLRSIITGNMFCDTKCSKIDLENLYQVLSSGLLAEVVDGHPPSEPVRHDEPLIVQ